MRGICGIPGFGNLWTTLWRNVRSLLQRICGDLWYKQLSCGAWTQSSIWFVASFLPPSIFFFKFISLQSLSYIIWVDFFLFCFHLLFDLLLLLIYLICIIIYRLSTFILYLSFYFLQHFNCFNLFPLYFICLLNFCFMYCILPLYVLLCTIYPSSWIRGPWPNGGCAKTNILPLPIFLSPIWITLFS